MTGNKEIPVITVEGPPRSTKQKKELVEWLTDALKKHRYPEDFTHISVIIKENPSENIGANRVLLSEKKKSWLISFFFFP